VDDEYNVTARITTGSPLREVSKTLCRWTEHHILKWDHVSTCYGS